MIDVLEHLNKKEGKALLRRAEKWAKKKVIVSTPNGFISQRAIDDNEYQSHRSGWMVSEMRQLGYKAYGMAGLKWLRKENQSEIDFSGGDIFATISFRPKSFWLLVSELTQLFTYLAPKIAFEVFYVKTFQN
jgi:hypothetical protein